MTKEFEELQETKELPGLMTKQTDRDVRQEAGGEEVWSLSTPISSRS